MKKALILLLGFFIALSAFCGELRIVQMCDPQLGMKDYRTELEDLKKAIEKVNLLKPDAVIICGDLVNDPGKTGYGDFKAAIKASTVPVYCVPGNHDIGGEPTMATIAAYEKEIGKDHYTVDINDYRLIVIDSMLWKYPAGKLARAQESWLKDELGKAAGEGRKVMVAGHVPLFIKTVDEVEEYFNVKPEKRREILDLLAANKVAVALFGHTHTSFQNIENGVTYINGPTTSINMDKKPLGFNLITISPETIKVEYITLE